MSTLATADLGSSDEEDDKDYVPKERPIKKRKVAGKKRTDPNGTRPGSESGSSSGSSSDSEAAEEDDNNDAQGEAARLRKKAEEAEAEDRRKRAAEAFAAFNDVAEPPRPSVASESGTLGDTCKAQDERQVSVKRERKFAGETIIETVSLPASHPDAIAFLTKERSGASTELPIIAAPATLPVSDKATTKAPDGQTAAEQGNPAAISSATSAPSGPGGISTPSSSSKPAVRGPPKRKPRQTLEQLSAGLSSGKKMTTLEKSQLDWKSHIASSSTVSDELDTHRRSGGYLEKRDFLDRVGDRRTEAFDSNKGGRR